jgi:2-keto-4-pentenoate hydratase/2-oxohepta-3-ene-1,7-dioic acid hydratase in catechol pathway
MRAFILLGDEGLDAAEAALKSGAGVVEGEWRLAAPLQTFTKNVVAVGRNYKAHIIEAARFRQVEVKFPPYVELFTKASTAVIGPDDEIRWDPRHTKQLDYEVEFTLVMGKQGRDIPAERAYEYIYGYTVGNDVSAREVQKMHGGNFKGKSLDTFCPLGPCIVPKRYLPNDDNLRLTMHVNGELRQDSNTSDLLFTTPVIVEQLSWGMSLDPGDVIMTGTPSGVGHSMVPQGFLKGGDVLEAAVEGIGVLRNRVVEV